MVNFSLKNLFIFFKYISCYYNDWTDCVNTIKVAHVKFLMAAEWLIYPCILIKLICILKRLKVKKNRPYIFMLI